MSDYKVTPKFVQHGVELETEAVGGGVVIRIGLEDQIAAARENEEGELGFGIKLQPTEAVEFAFAVIHCAWQQVRVRLGPLLELGFSMGWLEEKGIYKS